MKNLLTYTDWLNERKLFGNQIFSDPEFKTKDREKQPYFEEFYDLLKSEFKQSKEENTPIESEFLNLLFDWAFDSSDVDDETLKKLAKYERTFSRLKSEYPRFFKPETSTFWRGIDLSLSAFFDLIGTNAYNEKDWDYVTLKPAFTKPVKHAETSGNEVVYRYRLPIKWKERRPAQSWTNQYSDARTFGPFVLETEDDGKFFLNEKFANLFSEVIYEQKENESIHIGNTFGNPVYLHVPKWVMEKAGLLS